MPASIKLQEEFGDDLQVIFVESQGADRKQMEGFVLRRKWLGTAAMWTTERPLNSGSRGLPNYVLIGADGKVVQKGSHVTSKTGDLIAAEINAASRAPAHIPRALHAAWKSFGKGHVGQAMSAALEVRDRGELVDLADETMAAFRESVGGSLDQIEWCVENGFLVEAQGKLKRVMKGLEGAVSLLERATAIEERIDSPEMEAELEACKKFDRILRAVHEYGFGKKGKNRRVLERFAEAYPNTMAAARARHLLEL